MMHISSVGRTRALPLGLRRDRSTVQPVSDGPQGDRTGDDPGTYHRPPAPHWAEVARQARNAAVARGDANLARHVNTLA